MASRYRANGNKLRKRTANDHIGEEREITDLDFNAASAGCEDISTDFAIPNLSFNVASFIVCCVSIICYWNSCKGGFVFDDSEAIVSNKDLRDEIPLGKLFVHDFWGANLSSNASHKSYRPLTILTFRFNYWLAGGLNPWSFHVFNVVLHAVVSILSLKIFPVLISHTNNDKNKFSTPKASLFCALLFAVHPIHTESVSIEIFCFFVVGVMSISLTSIREVLLIRIFCLQVSVFIFFFQNLAGSFAKYFLPESYINV